MKLRKHNCTVLNAEDKFGYVCDASSPLKKLTREELSRLDLTQLGELASQLLNDKDLKVGKVHPFFWSMVETYVDRFQLYPFDINRALFSYLELHDFPEESVQELIHQLESQFEESHGRPLRRPAKQTNRKEVLDDEIKELRDSLKYAAMVAESDE
ncbi:MAG: hypothetical protein GQ549_04925 [Gammaproteobacteria bacterium]|nr:hypothetical protein [Gammaproteobacteria bacterium]